MDRWLSFSRFGSNRLPKSSPHLPAFLLILRVTYMRPSELLDMNTVGSCPVACATSSHDVRSLSQLGKREGRARTDVRDGSVLMHQCCFQWVDGQLEFSITLPQQKLFQTAIDALGHSELTMYPARRKRAATLFLNPLRKHSRDVSRCY